MEGTLPYACSVNVLGAKLLFFLDPCNSQSNHELAILLEKLLRFSNNRIVLRTRVYLPVWIDMVVKVAVVEERNTVRGTSIVQRATVVLYLNFLTKIPLRLFYFCKTFS